MPYTRGGKPRPQYPKEPIVLKPAPPAPRGTDGDASHDLDGRIDDLIAMQSRLHEAHVAKIEGIEGRLETRLEVVEGTLLQLGEKISGRLNYPIQSQPAPNRVSQVFGAYPIQGSTFGGRIRRVGLDSADLLRAMEHDSGVVAPFGTRHDIAPGRTTARGPIRVQPPRSRHRYTITVVEDSPAYYFDDVALNSMLWAGHNYRENLIKRLLSQGFNVWA